MRVKELIEELEKCDPKKEVCISIDEEGNDFKEIVEISEADGEEDWEGKKIEGYIIYPII